MFWKTDDKILARTVTTNKTESFDTISTVISSDSASKMYILDGQQRITSLNIAFQGSLMDEEVYFNLLWRNNTEEPVFIFSQEKSSSKFIKLKDIVSTKFRHKSNRKNFSKELCQELNISDPMRITDIIEEITHLRDIFFDKRMNFFLLDSIRDAFHGTDIIEIFARLNMRATKLSKADLIFSLMKFYWKEAENEFKSLEKLINKRGYNFTTDFLIKMSLIIIKEGSAFKTEKIQDPSKIEKIKQNWPRLRDAFLEVADFLEQYAKARSKNILKSYNTLIPIILYTYLQPNVKIPLGEHNAILRWIYLSLINSRIFSQDSNIDNINEMIFGNHEGSFPNQQIIREMREKHGKVISFDRAKLQVKSNRIIFLNILALINQSHGINFQPLYKKNKPQLDHIFPKSKLKDIGFQKEKIDHIANYCILTSHSNLSKSNKDPKIYLPSIPKYILDNHLIPNKPELWNYSSYERFILEREMLIYDAIYNFFFPHGEILETKSDEPIISRSKTISSYNPSKRTYMKELSRTDVKNELIIITKEGWPLFPDENTEITIKFNDNEFTTKLKSAPTATSYVRRFRGRNITQWFRNNKEVITEGIKVKFLKIGSYIYDLEISN